MRLTRRRPRSASRTALRPYRFAVGAAGSGDGGSCAARGPPRFGGRPFPPRPSGRRDELRSFRAIADLPPNGAQLVAEAVPPGPIARPPPLRPPPGPVGGPP